MNKSVMVLRTYNYLYAVYCGNYRFNMPSSVRVTDVI